MKKVNLNFPINDATGNKVGMANELIAGCLMYKDEKVDPVKYFDWAVKLGNKEDLLLDSSDFIKLRTTILEAPTIMVIIKGAVIKYLDTLKEEK